MTRFSSEEACLASLPTSTVQSNERLVINTTTTLQRYYCIITGGVSQYDKCNRTEEHAFFCVAVYQELSNPFPVKLPSVCFRFNPVINQLTLANY